MLARSVALHHYRNLADTRLEFSEGVNLLLGDNAQGKTNLLESVYLFAHGKSFRGSRDREVIRFDESDASAKLEFFADGRAQSAEMFFTPQKRRILLNGAETSARELIGAFRAVLFAPAHLQLIKGEPAGRRAFVDNAISQYRPAYLRNLMIYNRVLAERNKMLKQAAEAPLSQSDAMMLEVWSDRLARYAAEVMRERVRFVTMLGDIAFDVFLTMRRGYASEKPTVRYLPACGKCDNAMLFDSEATYAYLRRLYASGIDREKAAGATLWGPHRDDLDICLNGHSARLYASQGQQRSLVLAMKLSEGEICYAMTGERPVYLFDDVNSELDDGRRAYLVKECRGRQMIMTTCEIKQYAASTNVIHVRGGRLR